MTIEAQGTATGAAEEFGERKFAARWQKWHAAHEERLADPHGFLAVTALHWLDAEPRRFDGVPGVWVSTEQGVTVTLEPGEELAVDGAPVSGVHDFGVIPERGGRNTTYGGTVLEVAKRGGKDILRPRHPDHPLRVAFRGTPAYAPAERWVLQGR